MKNFSQKKNFTRRDFKLSESKLYYKITKFGDSNEVDIPYEDIEGDRVSFSSSNGFLFAVSIILFIVAIWTHISSYDYGEKRDPYMALFWAVLGVIFLVLYWFTRNNFWKLNLRNGSHVYIHKMVPNKEKTEQFITMIIKSRDQYLKENYSNIDENLDYEGQLRTLRWLKSINTLTKDEFDRKHEELKRIVKPEKPGIGFGK